MSFSVISFNSNPIDLEIIINISEASNVLVIVLGILGGILLIGLIVAAVCIVRKNQQARVSI